MVVFNEEVDVFGGEFVLVGFEECEGDVVGFDGVCFFDEFEEVVLELDWDFFCDGWKVVDVGD